MVRHGDSARRLTNALAILVVLLLGATALGAASWGSRNTSAGTGGSGTGTHHSIGPAQVAAARATLLAERATPPGHSGAPASGVSPGGYTWTNLSAIVPGGPSPRLAAGMAWDAADGYVLYYGGQDLHVHAIGDTWSYVNGTWTNLTATISGAPPSLILVSMAFDPSTHSVVLFGGITASSAPNGETWSYHNRTWTNLSGTVGAAPSARVVAAMSTDSTDGDVLLFGGSPTGGGVWITDTWTFKGGHWTNVTSIAGGAFGKLQLPVGSDDPADHGALVRALYPAGITDATATLIYSGGTWRNITSTLSQQPPLSEIGSAGYLAPISSVVSVSGITVNRTGGVVTESLTAEYSSGGWNNVTGVTAGPPVLNIFSSGAAIGTDESFLAMGLGSSSTVPASWLLSAPPKVTVSANHPSADPGATVAFTGSVSEGAAPYTYHWSFGDGSTAATLSGTHAFAHPGTYAANLTVTDLVGHSVTASVIVVVNPPLSFSASATPSPATANLTVALTSSVSGGTAPYSYRWTLGDTTTASSASLGHIYAKAGNYSVVANVTDALGQSASSSFTVQVNAAPHTSSTGGSSSVSLSSGTGLYLLLGIVLLAVVVVALAVMLARRPKSPPGPPAQYQTGPGAPPPGAGPTGAPPPN
ncbi:MAG: PKD domain-containing protein [Thermoplasmata archaeon]|nr:PKD domain-containing protein [Thermoplasmata archaeon]